MPDPRLTAHRGDTADAALRGQVEAKQFVDGTPHCVTAPILDLRLSATDTALATQMLCGEPFTVFGHDAQTGLSWGRSEVDGYVGYVDATHLGPPQTADLHVTAPFAQVYCEPSMKSVPVASLPFQARLTNAGAQGDFVKTQAGYVHKRHVAERAGDLVDFALPFVGTSYVWGGRSPAGLDCSALVQVSAMACDIACPRDSDMQWQGFGQTVPDLSDLQRGDLIFWKGHVGIMSDPTTLLHANAFHMAVTQEPLEVVADRIKTLEGNPILGARRVV